MSTRSDLLGDSTLHNESPTLKYGGLRPKGGSLDSDELKLSPDIDERKRSDEAKVNIFQVGHAAKKSETGPRKLITELPPQCPSWSTRRDIVERLRFPEELGLIEEADMSEPKAYVQRSPVHPMLQSICDESKSNPNSGQSYPPSPPPPAPPLSSPRHNPRPPPLFNKAIEADEYLNAAASRLYTGFVDELAKFVAQQSKVITLRLAVQEKRKELSQLREHVSHCDMLLFDCLRKQMSDGIANNECSVLALFEAAQAARDQIGSVESDYEPFEISLGAQEHKLVDQYSKIEDRFNKYLRLDVASVSEAEEREPPEIQYESSSGASVAEDSTQLYGADQLHGTLIGEHVGIGELPRHTKIHKLQPSPPNPQRLQTFHSRTASSQSINLSRPRYASSADKGIKLNDWAEALDLIGVWAPDAISLAEMNELYEGGPVSADIDLSDETIHINTPVPVSDLVDDLPVNPGLEEGNPLLLLDESGETRAILNHYLISFDSTPDRVNRWMLHQLRVSPHEIYTLRRYMDEVKKLSELDHWTTSVLNEWPHDSLGHSNSYYEDSVEFDESIENPQRVRYHGACSPGCAFNRSWQVPQSPTFSTGGMVPNPPAQLPGVAHFFNPHDLPIALNESSRRNTVAPSWRST